MITEKLLNACKKMQRDAQRKVYEHMAPKLYRSCKRYLKQEEEIEEALADAFYTIFTKLEQLTDWQSFEGWARKIVVNQCLLTIRKRVNFYMYIDDISLNSHPLSEAATDLEEEDLLKLLEKIPAGCRTVFNLFVIEGYSHKEISALLHVSEGTSKSQLNAAKQKLRELVNQLYFQKAT